MHNSSYPSVVIRVDELSVVTNLFVVQKLIPVNFRKSHQFLLIASEYPQN